MMHSTVKSACKQHPSVAIAFLAWDKGAVWCLEKLAMWCSHKAYACEEQGHEAQAKKMGSLAVDLHALVNKYL